LLFEPDLQRPARNGKCLKRALSIPARPMQPPARLLVSS
jgi:hypothetical protein